jgi:hypothetical protein
MPPRDPYSDTSVPSSRSRDAIRKLLIESGAEAVRFDAGRFEVLAGSDPEHPDPCVVEFIWPVAHGRRQMVRVQTTPQMPTRTRRTSYSSRPAAWKVSPEQRERQAWRGLYWYLKGALDAARFGVIQFEDVFLSFIVTEGAGSPTVGEVLVPRIQAGAKALIGHHSAHELKSGDVVDAEVVEP